MASETALKQEAKRWVDLCNASGATPVALEMFTDYSDIISSCGAITTNTSGSYYTFSTIPFMSIYNYTNAWVRSCICPKITSGDNAGRLACWDGNSCTSNPAAFFSSSVEMNDLATYSVIKKECLNYSGGLAATKQRIEHYSTTGYVREINDFFELSSEMCSYVGISPSSLCNDTAAIRVQSASDFNKCSAEGGLIVDAKNYSGCYVPSYCLGRQNCMINGFLCTTNNSFNCVGGTVGGTVGNRTYTSSFAPGTQGCLQGYGYFYCKYDGTITPQEWWTTTNHPCS